MTKTLLKRWDWNWFEKGLLLVNVAISLVFFFMAKDYGSTVGWIGLVSSITNTVCVILVAKRKISNYAWGIIAVLTYAFVAFSFQNTGEWMLNLLYYFPANIIGWVMWSRQRSDANAAEVEARTMTLKQSLIAYGLTIVGIFLYALLINNPDVQVFLYGAVSNYGFA